MFDQFNLNIWEGLVGPQPSWDLLHLYIKTGIQVGALAPKYSITT